MDATMSMTSDEVTYNRRKASTWAYLAKILVDLSKAMESARIRIYKQNPLQGPGAMWIPPINRLPVWMRRRNRALHWHREACENIVTLHEMAIINSTSICDVPKMTPNESEVVDAV